MRWITHAVHVFVIICDTFFACCHEKAMISILAEHKISKARTTSCTFELSAST